MENLADGNDREIRKEIAASAGASEPPTIFTRAFQYFFVPLAILGVCVGLYALVSVLVNKKRDPRAIIEEFKTGGPPARRHAASALAGVLFDQQEHPDQTLTPDVLAAYRELQPGERDREARVYIIRCLGLLRDSRASETLLEGLRNDPDLSIKSACLDALGAIKDRATIPEILKFLDHPDALVRKYAVFNLGAICGIGENPAVAEKMRRLLQDPVEDVRWNAAFSLAYFMRDSSGRDLLRSMLDRPYLEKVVGGDPERDFLVQHAMSHACTALAALKDQESLPKIRDVGTHDRDQDVRRVAQEAVRELEKQ